MSKLKHGLIQSVTENKIHIFGSREVKTQTQVLIDNVEIERVNKFKILGATLDRELCWKPHITNIQLKMARTVAVLVKARPILDTQSLHIRYCSLILPYLSYGALV